MKKKALTTTVDADLFRALERLAGQRGTSRSAVVERALSAYLTQLPELMMPNLKSIEESIPNTANRED